MSLGRQVAQSVAPATPSRTAAPPRRTERGRTSSAPRTRPDRVTVSNQPRPPRSSTLERARSRAGSFFRGLGQDLSEGVTSLAGAGSRGIQGVADFLGDRVGDAVRVQGVVQGAVTRTGSSAVAGVLDATGNQAAATRVRRAGQAASQVIEGTTGQAAEMAGDFVSGVGDGVGGIVEGVGTMVANPVQTLEGLNRLNQVVNPLAQAGEMMRGRSFMDIQRENQETLTGIVDGVREEYRKTGEDHGGAGQAGRAVFDVVSTVLTGGSGAAGRTGIRAAANTLDDVARVSRATAAGGEVAQVGRTANSVGGFLGRQADGPLAGVANRVTEAAERLSEAGVRRADNLDARTKARGAERVRQGEVPGAEGAKELRSSRGRASDLRDGLGDTKKRWENGGAQRQEVIEQLPAPTQRRVRDLEAEGRGAEALELVQRNQVEQAIRSSLDEVGRVDDMYPSKLPDDVDPSRVLAQGRRDSLEYMLNDPKLSADGLRRNFRHIVGDSDVTGPVFIQQFKAGDEVGRAFSTSAGRQTGVRSRSAMEGGYFGSAADARLSRSQIQKQNALGLDNHADKFATFRIPEDTYGVVSRIGEQFDNYGGHAVGGNVQITFPGSVAPQVQRVSDVGRVSKATQRTADGVVLSGDSGQIMSEEDQ